MLLLAANLTRGSLGRTLVAIRDGERAAPTLGVDAARVKALLFACSAAFAGVGGALFAYALGFVAPESFTLLLSFTFLGAVVVGGLGTVAGAVLGALFVVFVPQYAERRQPGAHRRDLRRHPDRGHVPAARRRRRAAPPAAPAARRGGRAAPSPTPPTTPDLSEEATDAVPTSDPAPAGSPGCCGRRPAAVTTTPAAVAGQRPPTPASPTPPSRSAAATRSAGRPRRTASIPKALNGYFKKVNEAGGVNGRKIEFVTYDDGYEPQRALTNARRLVEQDKVFALFNPLGTANNVAMRDYLNQKQGAAAVRRHRRHGLRRGRRRSTRTRSAGSPRYQTESKVYAEYLKTAKPNAKVAVLYQNDGFGKDLLGGFTDGIEGSEIKVVAQETLRGRPTRPSPRR